MFFFDTVWYGTSSLSGCLQLLSSCFLITSLLPHSSPVSSCSALSARISLKSPLEPLRTVVMVNKTKQHSLTSRVELLGPVFPIHAAFYPFPFTMYVTQIYQQQEHWGSFKEYLFLITRLKISISSSGQWSHAFWVFLFFFFLVTFKINAFRKVGHYKYLILQIFHYRHIYQGASRSHSLNSMAIIH